MLTSRRGLLAGLGAMIVAPAVVKASSLMPIKALPAWYGPAILVPGDIITIEGVRAFNRMTKREEPYLRQFVVTAAATSHDRLPSIYPPIDVSGIHRTVVSAPNIGAKITRLQLPPPKVVEIPGGIEISF